jgi:hypothetical protein
VRMRTGGISISAYQPIGLKKLRTDLVSAEYITPGICVLISLGNFGLTGFENLDRRYLVSLSSHQLTAAAALRCRCCSREKSPSITQ